ncbi:MAG: hypothetical protein DMF06_00645 [Verrucomicrobia bacterium]|nr:MAG: hypothetical protein DMF06_00645 [Verrucomicrobiota bacterium]
MERLRAWVGGVGLGVAEGVTVGVGGGVGVNVGVGDGVGEAPGVAVGPIVGVGGSMTATKIVPLVPIMEGLTVSLAVIV